MELRHSETEWEAGHGVRRATASVSPFPSDWDGGDGRGERAETAVWIESPRFGNQSRRRVSGNAMTDRQPQIPEFCPLSPVPVFWDGGEGRVRGKERRCGSNIRGLEIGHDAG